MINNKKIPYRKELPPKATKQLGSGGPRDMQRRQTIGTATIDMPKINMEALKEVLLSNKLIKEELKVEIRKEMDVVKEAVESNKNIERIGLPFAVVEQKLKEVAEQTEKGVREKYESGLGNLNSQLNSAKAQVKDFDGRLAERKLEIVELKNQLTKQVSMIEDKDYLINTLREQQNQEVGDLRVKIMDLIEKIKSGKITSDNYDEARPLLEDKIFIDPIEKGQEPVLDSHIDITEDKSSKTDSERDMNSDLTKLRNLLKL